MTIVRRDPGSVQVQQPGKAVQGEPWEGGGQGEGVSLQDQGPQAGQGGQGLHHDTMSLEVRPAEVQRDQIGRAHV